MTEPALDYANTIIYKIVCKDETVVDCYVGHTVDFIHRQYQHKADLKIRTHPLQLCILNNGGWDNWDMIEIEKYNCLNQIEARIRERYWCELLKSNLNGQSPIQTKEDISKRKRIHYELNKEVILQQRKLNPSRTQEENKLYMKQYNAINYEVQREKAKEVISCECGSHTTKQHLQRHLKTQKHLNFINSKQSTCYNPLDLDTP